MTIRIVVFLLTLTLTLASTAIEIVPGARIRKVVAAMKKEGFNNSHLAMGHADRSVRMKFFKVEPGTLIIVYSKTDKKVVSLSYQLSDGRAKSESKTFSFTVLSFDTETGEMRVATQNKTNPKDRHGR